ncbi:sugar transferase [Planobispora rosea]|uniref:sugar transferase n=1 Tax=Planobispora rosea TaxID=35762 RepID=UPI00083B7869|nr:sugar transferase [Planobispora rosea]
MTTTIRDSRPSGATSGSISRGTAPGGRIPHRRTTRRPRTGRRPLPRVGLPAADAVCAVTAVTASASVAGSITASVAVSVTTSATASVAVPVTPSTATPSPAVAVTAALLLIAVNAVLGLYRQRLVPSVLDDLPSLAGGGAVAMALAPALAPLLIPVPALGAAAPPAGGLSGWAVAVALHTVLACGVRGASYAAVRGRRTGSGARPTLLIGTGSHRHRLAAALLDHPEYGMAPVGVVDDRQSPEPGIVPVLGRTGRFAEILRAHRIHTVIVTPAAADVAAHRLAGVARDLGCEVLLAPEPGGLLADFLPPRDHIWGFPVLRIRPLPQARPAWPLKRALDIVLALAGLVVCAPVIAVCALAVRCESGPGVLFRQTRVGCGGRRFELLKLRTLRPGDPHESETRWSIADDRRVGPVGRLLRRTSLDELPQLWNILRGDMSVVGPRPERPFFVDRFSASLPDYDERHRVPAGLTGWAQVHGLRGDTSIEDRARFDNHYIDGWTLRSDMKIVLRTVVSAFRPSGS